MPNVAVAKHMGIPRQTISRWMPGKDPHLIRKWKRATPLLGLESDADIGRKVGLSKSSIANLRNKKNIPPYISPLSTRARAIRERNNRAEKFAEKQVGQELMNAWRSP